LTQAAFNGRAKVTFIFRRSGILPHHVPRARSTQDPDLAQLSGDWLKTTTERRILDLSPRAIVPNGWSRIVDGHGVARHGESWPRRVRIVGLAEHEIVTPAGKFDCLQIGCPERPGRGIERRAGVLGARRHGPQHYECNRDQQASFHGCPRLTQHLTSKQAFKNAGYDLSPLRG
jgi:hypothetical protein